VKIMKRFNASAQQYLSWGLLALIMLVYAVVMSQQSILRYDTFKATAFDLGNMDQVLWNTLHGRPFQFTNQAIDWYGPPTRLAIHFELIILPLSLLYLFHADPRILLVFQTLALTSGALPVFLLTRKHLPRWPLLAAFMAGAYLLSPALLGLNIFDFHPVSLATPLLLYAMLALTYKRYVWFIIACIFAASCKEDVPLAIAMLGILLIWKYKLPRLGTTLLVGGFLWSFLAFAVIIPHFYPGAQQNNFWYRYEALGSSPGAAIVNLIVHPWLLFTTFITLDRLYYLGDLFRSTGFLALLAPEWLLPALPSLAVNLLSTDPLLYSGVYHYNATIIPFIMLSSIHGARRLIMLWQEWRGENVPTEEDDQRSETINVVAPLVGARLPLVGARQSTTRSTAQSIAQSTVQSIAYHLIAAFRHMVAMMRTRLSSFMRSIQQRLVRFARRSVQWERFNERMVALAKSISLPRLQWVLFAWITIMLVINFMIATPRLNAFWADHQPGSREQHIQQLLDMIPPDASISAGSNLNPHLSERQYLAVFPSICMNTSCSATAQYIIVDLNAVLPEDRTETTSELNQLVHSGQFRVLARAEGVVLLVATSRVHRGGRP